MYDCHTIYISMHIVQEPYKCMTVHNCTVALYTCVQLYNCAAVHFYCWCILVNKVQLQRRTVSTFVEVAHPGAQGTMCTVQSVQLYCRYDVHRWRIQVYKVQCVQYKVYNCTVGTMYTHRWHIQVHKVQCTMYTHTGGASRSPLLRPCQPPLGHTCYFSH